MSRKRYKPEQIINLLTEALIANPVIIFGRSNVRCWLKADMQPPEYEVRSTPKSGHSEARAGLPLVTPNGH